MTKKAAITKNRKAIVGISLHQSSEREPRTRTPKENPEAQQAGYGAGKFPTGQASSMRDNQVLYGAGKLGAGQAGGVGKRIVVGMSGGIDSSMALVLLKKQGFEPIGVSLKLPVWKDPEGPAKVSSKFRRTYGAGKENLLRENILCTTKSLNIARKICKRLNVPYYVFDVRKDFQKEVTDYFIRELKNNRTPNPCIICNRYLKFKKLFEFAKMVGARFVATGHYARLHEIKNQKSLHHPPKFLWSKNLGGGTGQAKIKKFKLLKPKDKSKDQTYVLSFLPQRWLKYIVFPLGDYTKEEIYQMAKKEGFDFFLKKRQSQDFCFVAGKSLPHFIKNKIGKKSGLIISSKGKVLGKHEGIHFYTIGQRKGLNLPGGPYFVKGFDKSKNILIVTKNQKEISQKEIKLWPFHFISGEAPERKIEVTAKVRYQASLSKAILFPFTPLDSKHLTGREGRKTKIVFKKPQRAVTPGQFCVFYQGDVCLGGGVINFS